MSYLTMLGHRMATNITVKVLRVVRCSLFIRLLSVSLH